MQTWRKINLSGHKYESFIVCAFIVAILFGLSGSSLGISTLRSGNEFPSISDATIGTPRAIRTDEYLRVTPWRLGVFENNGSLDFATPLGSTPSSLVTTAPSDLITNIFQFETSLSLIFGLLTPISGLSFLWWFHLFVCLFFLPKILINLGVSKTRAIVATILICTSPLVAWWSLAPINPLSWTVLASYSVQRIARFETLSRKKILWEAIAALSVVRLGLSYIPWAVPIGAIILLPTLISEFKFSRTKRSTLFSYLRTLSASGMLLFLYLFIHRQELESLAGTEYPGSRRFVGTASSIDSLFTAPFSYVLNSDPGLVATNQSEVSSSYLILIVPGIIYLFWKKNSDSKQQIFASISFLAVSLLSVWTLVDLPQIFSKLFPLNLVSPNRLSVVLGFGAILIFALGHSFAGKLTSNSFLVSGIISFLVLVLLLNSASYFKRNVIPDVSQQKLWTLSLIFSLCVFLALYFAHKDWSIIPLAVFSLAAFIGVNPVQLGSGELRHGQPAESLKSLPLKSGQYMASDSAAVDAIAMSNAIPSISGQQWVGPNSEAWLEIDNENVYKSIWNRGQSYITFSWVIGQEQAVIDAPAGDIIRITVSPCSESLKTLGLQYVTSMQEFNESCLSGVGQFYFGGASHNIYKVN